MNQGEERGFTEGRFASLPLAELNGLISVLENHLPKHLAHSIAVEDSLPELKAERDRREGKAK